MRVVLQTGHDGEPGVEAWALDWLGLATWAETRGAVLARLPTKLAAHRDLLTRQGIDAPPADLEVEIAEELHGDEIAFPWDREPSSASEVHHALRLLEATRAELTSVVAAAPSAALDWDPPYRHFASWASWRTIRANLAHVANAETQYYTRNVGFSCPFGPAPADGDWRELLPRHRAAAVEFLTSVAGSTDLLRLGTPHGEHWSLRKCLRRMVRHEIQHTRSIERILRTFAAQPAGGPR